jgi:anti-sigma B factor antagonist
VRNAPQERFEIVLEINHREREEIAILDLNGQLTCGQEDLDFRNELNNLLKIGKARVVLNLSGLRRLDKTGMGTLLFARNRLRDAGGNLAIVIMRPSHVGLVTEAHLETVFEVVHDEQDAIDSFFPDREIKGMTATDSTAGIASASYLANADL